MKTKSLTSKSIAFLLSIILLALPMAMDAKANHQMEIAQEQTNDSSFATGYSQGQMDGEMAAKGAWFFAGCFLTWVGVVLAYFVTPSPNPQALMGKPTEYVLGYNEGFKKSAGKKNAKSAMYGCVATGVVYVIVYAAALGTYATY